MQQLMRQHSAAAPAPREAAAKAATRRPRAHVPLGLGAAAAGIGHAFGRACSCSAAAPNAASTSAAPSAILEVATTATFAAGHHQQLSAAVAASGQPAPFAAFRMLLTGQNTTNLFRNTFQQAGSKGGPISLLLFALTLVAAAFAAIRGALARKVKGCEQCRGYGVTRCRLCNGAGRVDWAAKLSHYAACPLCMNRRYIVCCECGGGYHRPLFSHMRRRQGYNNDLSDLMDSSGATTAAIGAAAAAASTAVPARRSASKSPLGSLASPLSSVDFSTGVASARND